MIHAYLVDFENVAKKGLIGMDELNTYDLLYIFYSNSKSNITTGLREDMGQPALFCSMVRCHM